MTTSFEKGIQGYEYLGRIVLQHNLCTACMKLVGRSQELVESFRASLLIKNQFLPEKVKKITPELVNAIIRQARETEQGEFSLLCRNTLVALCSGLESLVKDIVATTIVEKPEYIGRLKDSKLRIAASDFLAQSIDDRANILVDTLYREESANTGHVEKYMRLLKYVDLNTEIKITSDQKSKIDEAYELRNVIVHRGGKMDQRLKLRAPGLRQNIGESIELDAKSFSIYQDAIFAFADALVIGEL